MGAEWIISIYQPRIGGFPEIGACRRIVAKIPLDSDEPARYQPIPVGRMDRIEVRGIGHVETHALERRIAGNTLSVIGLLLDVGTLVRAARL